MALYPWLISSWERLRAQKRRLPNALMLYGPKGVGCFRLARAFVASLFCTNSDAQGFACGHCRACSQIQFESHPDVRFIVPENARARLGLPLRETKSKAKPSREILIGQIRSLREVWSLSSYYGGARIVLIYPAESIRAEAAAALLKTMEEPPEGCHFVLVTEDLDRVLPTIRSRSRLFRVPMPHRADVLPWLRERGVKDASGRLHLVGGAPLFALEEARQGLLSVAEEEGLIALLRAGSQSTVARMLAAYQKTWTSHVVYFYLSRWYHDLLRVKDGLTPRYYPKEAGVMLQLVGPVSRISLWQAQREFIANKRWLDHPLNRQQFFEGVWLRYVRALLTRG